ncbi:hypothetical protein S40293_07376 [Stachybotrys chartarum IBT 40293]|nr:hypothetical protein S40293_07376 [Stachybotrys chartarum IBT 40293]
MSGATGSLLHDVIRQAHASRSSDRPQDSVHGVYRFLNLILAEGGPLLQVTDNKGQLPLHIAVKYGLEKVCTQIVSAIQRGLLVVVESLLAANIDPNIYDSQGVTPVLLASSQGKVKISEALLPAGANATVTDSRGWLPKDYAAYHDHLELAQKLPGRGSSVIHADLGKKTPARTILPVRPPGDSVIFVNIRTLDLRKGDVVGIDLPPYKSKQLPRVVVETGLVLRISLVGDECQSYAEVLPILTDRSDVPWCFKTPAPEQAALLFQVQHRGDDQPIAAARLPALGAIEVSMLFGLGEKYQGFAGNGQNNGKQEQLQIGENTTQSFQTAIDHGATVVEFDVQWEKGMDATMHTLKLERSTGTTANNAEVEKLIHQMKHTLNYPAYKPNLRTSNFHEAFIKLEELFHILSEDVVLDMEIKYPMFFKADDFEMDTYALELNYLVKTILGCFQALWTKTPDRARCLAISEPSAISDSAVNLHPSPTFSPKRGAFCAPVRLAGVAMAAEPFVLAPGLIGLVKERGLFTISYGNLNDMVEAAKNAIFVSACAATSTEHAMSDVDHG